MENFKTVSLGFAEFVSQLLQETFESILSAQNDQLERFNEFERVLNLSDEQFAAAHLTEDEITDKIIEVFGVEIITGMSVNQELQTIIKHEIGETEEVVRRRKLTASGSQILRSFAINLLVSTKKTALTQLLNMAETTRLIVDSGEISAKLELACLYGTEAKETTQAKTRVKEVPPTKTEEVNLGTSITTLSKDTELKKPIAIKEVVDEQNQTTLIIDKTQLKESSKINFSIPSVRVTAKPAAMNSSSNLFSEVKIRFKTL